MRCLIATLILAFGWIHSAEAGGTHHVQAIAVPLVVHDVGHGTRVQLLVTPVASPVVVLFSDVPTRSFSITRSRRVVGRLGGCN